MPFRSLPDIEESGSFDPAKFMSGSRNEISLDIIYVQDLVTVVLGGVSMEEQIVLMRDLCQFFNRFNGSDFIVRSHH